jgi:DnaJ like chaperone protein
MALGKWILGGLGFVLGGPIGALIGVLSASVFDVKSFVYDEVERNKRSSQAKQRATQGDIRVSIIVLIACVIKADGRVLKSEVNFIKPFLLRTFGDEGAKQALLLLKELLQKELDYQSIAQQIGQYVNYSTRLELINLLLQIAKADGDLNVSELHMIEQIAFSMSVKDVDYQSLLSLYQREIDQDWAYKALEIEPAASNEQVKKAYRRMAMKYHPDKVANAGEEIRQQATDKFRGINEAYEYIKQQRGL